MVKQAEVVGTVEGVQTPTDVVGRYQPAGIPTTTKHKKARYYETLEAFVEAARDIGINVVYIDIPTATRGIAMKNYHEKEAPK